ncbi:racemase [Azotobacter chroococcum subsp. isscasi]|uniref:aspartate/glutamate racemase family protein n=1 Tax=Azotobacter chroococcum TaxID=353 RepID=UPI00103A0820|nr:aspartate/glutamate racemase family protein [Azotobacter chroococcum]TBW06664.1 racemase [Azotobacter chroococcum subsp. isscasi]
MGAIKKFNPYRVDGIVKIKIVIPVNTIAFNELILSAAKSVASSSTYIEIENITEGSPFIENKYHSALNAPAVIELIQKAEQDGFDAVYVCDMDMCGVDAARTQVNIPVQGGFSTSIPQAVSFGRFSIISIVDGAEEMQREFACRFGGRENLVSIRHTGLHVHELTRPDLVFDRAYLTTLKAIEEDKAQAIVFGCSGFVDMAERIVKKLAIERNGLYVPIIDPNRVAILSLELQVKTGLCHKYHTQALEEK